MADRKDLLTAISSVGIPVFYNSAKSDQAMPYIIYFFKQTRDSYYADDVLYHRNERYDVELDEAAKDFELEAKICAALEDAGIPYDRYEYPQDDGWIQQIFETTVISK